METKLRKDLSNFEIIDFIQRDLHFNKKMHYEDMISYIKAELTAYGHPLKIEESERPYQNKFHNVLRLTTLTTPSLKVIIRETINETADIKFVPIDADAAISGQKVREEELDEI